MSDEGWIELSEFPGYSVSWLGDVRNDNTGRILRPRINNRGIPFVGLMRDGVQHQRGVAQLVAQTFLTPYTRYTTTPINKDGDRMNNRVDNLAFRSYGDAVAYYRQFHQTSFTVLQNRRRIQATGVVVDEKGNEYADTFEAAIKNGLLEKDVIRSILDRSYYGIILYPDAGGRFSVVK